MPGMNMVNDAVASLLAVMPQFANALVQSTGTATAGTSTTLVDTVRDPWEAGEWVNGTVTITAGLGIGQSRFITANTTTTLTVSLAWVTTPDATSVYSITKPNVYNYDPLLIDGASFPYALVDVTSSDESRRGFGDTQGAGKKYVRHQIQILVHNVTATPQIGEGVFRDLLDAIRAVLRVNQTLGSTFGILRCGEDIQVTFNKQRGSDLMTSYDAEISTECLEEIDG